MSSEAKIFPIHPSASAADRVEMLFKKYYPMLCQGVYNILKDRELSEDVVQEVFIKIWEKKDKLELDDKFVFYLKKACHNAALNTLSSLKSKVKEPVENKIVTSHDNADAQMLHTELNITLQEAISELPEKTRLVFTLSRYEEMSYKQIAEQLQVSIKAVEKHMGIALQRLRISLKDHLYIILIAFLKDL